MLRLNLLWFGMVPFSTRPPFELANYYPIGGDSVPYVFRALGSRNLPPVSNKRYISHTLIAAGVALAWLLLRLRPLPMLLLLLLLLALAADPNPNPYEKWAQDMNVHVLTTSQP